MQPRKLHPADTELANAVKFQASLLARECPQCADRACVATLYQPAVGASGDFYDIIPAGEERRWFLIGDVCSRGTQSALLMALVLGYLWGAGRAPDEPADVARSLNDFLLTHKERIPGGEMVTTLFLGLLDLPSLTMSYINAGHPSPIVQRQKSRLTRTFGEPGVLLGSETNADWIQSEISFEPGDRLLLYTDGILVARVATGETLGQEGLIDVLESSIDEQDDHAVLQRLSGRLARRGAFASPDDDRSVVLTSFVGARHV